MLDLAKDPTQRVLVADPNLETLPKQLLGLPNLEFVDTLEAVRRADIVAILMAHTAFKRIPREELMRRVVIDATGLTQKPEAA